MAVAEANSLFLINRNIDIWQGTFSRFSSGSAAILDYAMVSNFVKHSVLRMGIDEALDLLSDSDHVAIRVDICLNGQSPEVAPARSSLFLKPNRDQGRAKNKMDVQPVEAS